MSGGYVRQTRYDGWHIEGSIASRRRILDFVKMCLQFFSSPIYLSLSHRLCKLRISTKPPPFFMYKPLLPPALSLPFQSLPKPSRQLRLMPPRLRIMRRTLPVRTAHPTGDRWPTGQVCAAVAAVEGVFYRRSCGGVDGEVGFWGDSVAWVGRGG